MDLSQASLKLVSYLINSGLEVCVRMYLCVCVPVLADNMMFPYLLHFKAQEQRLIEGSSVWEVKGIRLRQLLNSLIGS